MKVLFPRNIQKWFFSSLSFSIWPLNVNLVQLFILVVGVMFSFLIANYLLKNGNHKMVAVAAGAPFTLVAFAIAFFKVSEMGLLEFLAKVARTTMFDSPKKFQVNMESIDKTTLLIRKNTSKEQPKKIVFKTQKNISPDSIQEKIENSWLL